MWRYICLPFFLLLWNDIGLAKEASESILLPSESGFDGSRSPVCSSPDPNLNYRPVIGILSHPGDGASGRLTNDTSSTYIAASYVKFAEAGGARVIPLIYNEPEEVLFQKLELVNGVIFTGGWAKKYDYFEIVKKIFTKALERNDAGEHFPVYGICLGFELMSIIISQNRDILERFDAEDNASSLQFVDNVNNDGTLFQRFPPELLKKLSTDCLVMQKHKDELLPMVQAKNLTLSFSSESSIEEELKRESTADVITIAISYLVMFAYISLTLGDSPRLKSFYITSKVLLGLSGVLLVMLSVLGSVGFFSAVGMKSTLIIMEVIPFLVLAVGVDNMCILVHAVKRQEQELPLERRISNALMEVGPSITLASLAEILAFAVGAFIKMPAVRVFSMFAALAVLLDFLLQITAFVALIVFDFRRTEDKRVDCFPCIKTSKSSISAEKGVGQRKAGLLTRYMKGYFNNISTYLRIGPPLYFVLKNYNYSSESRHTNQLCSINKCNPNSLLNEIARASLTPELSYIAKPAASWLDDFLVWLSPEAFGCCRKFTNGTFCPPDDQPPCCPPGQTSCGLSEVCKDCTTCFRHADLSSDRPSTTQFKEKLPWFLNALPSADCAKGGHGAYSSSVDLQGYANGIIQASSFRTYHTPLNKQVDFVNSMRAAQEFSAKVSRSLKMEIYPYSVFYMFFEQYLDIWKTALINLSIAIAAVFVVCLIITCSFWSSAIILLVIAMIIIDLLGVMAVFHIQLNALSVVNLIMSVGIAVEFCVHITHAFSISTGDRNHRMKEALGGMGASVFSGITLTKLVGVIVLGFSRSEVFVVYYFKMYLALVLLGFLHGLVFLPVFLSMFGPAPRHVEGERQDHRPSVSSVP